jgi:hypothetical protein
VPVAAPKRAALASLALALVACNSRGPGSGTAADGGAATGGDKAAAAPWTSGAGFTLPLPDGFARYPEGFGEQAKDEQLMQAVRAGTVVLVSRHSSGPLRERGLIAVSARRRPPVDPGTKVGCTRAAGMYAKAAEGNFKSGQLIDLPTGRSCELVYQQGGGDGKPPAREERVIVVHVRDIPLWWSVVCTRDPGDGATLDACRAVARGFRHDPDARPPEPKATAEQVEAEARVGAVKRAERDLGLLHNAVRRYQLAHQRACPAELEDLVKDGLLDKVPVDPWGEPYAFRCPRPGTKHAWDLSSKGADRTAGTVDDIALDARK